jgi:hypothetical protein
MKKNNKSDQRRLSKILEEEKGSGENYEERSSKSFGLNIQKKYASQKAIIIDNEEEEDSKFSDSSSE